jgi:imidazolonepropionase-like amidohydrolase
MCVFVGSVLMAQDAPTPQPFALAHVTVIDVRDGALRRDHTVVIQGDRISIVGATARTTVPGSARVIDARGHYLIPGLWDMHVHSAVSADWHFPLFVTYGATGVRNMHSTVKSPLELTRTVKARLASGELLGPRFVANGPVVDGEPATFPGSVVVRAAADARAAVDALVDGGADFIKVYDNLSRDAYLSIAVHAKRRGVPLLGHVPFAVRPEEAAAAGHRTDEHLTGFESGCSSRAEVVRAERRRIAERRASASRVETDVALFRLDRELYDSRDPSLCKSVAQAYLRSGTMVVPNLVIHRNNQWPDTVLSDTASMRFIPTRVRQSWERRAGPGPGAEIRGLLTPTWSGRLDNVRLLRDMRVPILAGTDVGNALLVPGLSLHQELALLVEAGLSPLEALQAATVAAARSLNKADSLGSIEPNKLADLVLLDANPLQDIRNTQKIAAVVVNGRYLDRQALNDLLAALERAAKGPAQ